MHALNETFSEEKKVAFPGKDIHSSGHLCSALFKVLCVVNAIKRQIVEGHVLKNLLFLDF